MKPTDSTNQTTEHRLMFCEACGGDGGFEENCLSIGGYDSTRWVRCVACDGEGEVEVEMLPVTADDMEHLAQAATLAEFEAPRRDAEDFEVSEPRTTGLYALLREKVDEMTRRHGNLTDAEIVDALTWPSDTPITLDHEPEPTK